MRKLVSCISFIMFCLYLGQAAAQVGYNPNSVRPILEDDVMWRKTVWNVINLKEKQNKPFFAQNQWITKILIDGVRSGELQAYVAEGDSANEESKLSIEDFERNLLVNPDAEEEGPIYPSEITMLELREDLLFDKRRSRMYYDIQTVKMIAPPLPNSPDPSQREIAKFKYVDLSNYFRKIYNESGQSQAIWYNPLNNRRQLCFTDALDLRLFSSRIVKVSNPDDEFIDTDPEYMNSIEKQLYRSQELEYELMEFEHNLWEY